MKKNAFVIGSIGEWGGMLYVPLKFSANEVLFILIGSSVQVCSYSNLGCVRKLV